MDQNHSATMVIVGVSLQNDYPLVMTNIAIENDHL